MLTEITCLFGKSFIRPFVKKYSAENLTNIKANKILIIKSGAIGDVLMSTPFLRALKKRFPSAEIDYLTGTISAKVLEGNKNISNLITINSEYFHSLNLLHKIELLNKIKKKEYDLCFILDKSWLANMLIWFSRIPIRIGFDRLGEGFANNTNIKYRELKHEIEYYLELAYSVGAKEEKNKNLELNLSEEDKKLAEEFFKKNKIKNAIAITPGGGKNPGVGVDLTRIWPEQNFVELINMLEDKKIILIGGEQDKELCERIILSVKEKLKENPINLAGQTSLKQSAAIMQKCSFIITNDTGPMHIASAVNDRVISIFGPTHPLRKAPLNKKSKWIWNDENKYDWRCDVYSTKYAEGKEFMKEISPKLVFETVKNVMKE